MKFFTPELYSQGNSRDDELVDQTELEWERRLKRYRRHYKKIESQLPAMLRSFHDVQCLHDADLFSPALLPRSAPWNGQEVIIVAQQTNTLVPESLNTLAILQYTIAAQPTIEDPREAPGFRLGRPIWLYDEVDLIEPGVFSHEILISDGRVIKLLFSDFTYHIAPLCKEGQASSQPASSKKPKKQLASA